MSAPVYFKSSNGEGNWFVCVQATSPGESPETAPAKWRQVEIPALFERYLTQAAYAVLMTPEGQNDKRSMEENKATTILEQIVAQEMAQEDNAAGRRSRRFP